MAAIEERHPQQVTVLNAVDSATLATLTTNPRDAAARVQALTQLSGLPARDVRRVWR